MKCLGEKALYKGRGRAPQGARGLKYNMPSQMEHSPKGRAPQGARGLKCTRSACSDTSIFVAPRKGRVG